MNYSIAINYLNQKCFNEFLNYISIRYPNQNLTRNGQPIENLIRNLNEPIIHPQVQQIEHSTKPAEFDYIQDIDVEIPTINQYTQPQIIHQPILKTSQPTPIRKIKEPVQSSIQSSASDEPQEKLQLPVEVPRYSAVEPQEKLKFPIEVPRRIANYLQES